MTERHRFTRDDNLYEDFKPGETLVHPRGRTVSDEHMIWTNFVLNTAQLHFNQKMCDDHPEVTFDGRRVVYVFAGDTLFAESTVVSKTEDDPRLSAFAKPGQAGVVKFLLRGKNQKGEVVLEITRELAILKREFRP